MQKIFIASLLVLSTVVLPAAANAQGFLNRYGYGGYGGWGGYGGYNGWNRGTFIDRLVGNGGGYGAGYGGGYGWRGYYPGNSWYGHHHKHHGCGGGGWGRHW